MSRRRVQSILGVRLKLLVGAITDDVLHRIAVDTIHPVNSAVAVISSRLSLIFSIVSFNPPSYFVNGHVSTMRFIG